MIDIAHVILVDENDLSLRADCLRYIRADENDVDDRWDDILERCDEIVARAFMKTDHIKDHIDPVTDQMPTLLDVVDDGIASEWLVFATEEEKTDVVNHLDEAVAEHEKENQPSA